MDNFITNLDPNSHYGPQKIVWRVCPNLLKQDERHGLAHFKWHHTWRNPMHKNYLEDKEGHTANTLIYGDRDETEDEWPRCDFCGEKLVCTDSVVVK